MSDNPKEGEDDGEERGLVAEQLAAAVVRAGRAFVILFAWKNCDEKKGRDLRLECELVKVLPICNCQIK